MDGPADGSGIAAKAASFRREHEDCLAEAAATDVPSTKAQWLVFAQEWLKLALAAEEQMKADAGNGRIDRK